MQVLIVGSGGREHALAWACAQHASRPTIICAPGNPGTAELGENVTLTATDAAGIARLARDRGVDLVLVGPDAALAAGVADACRDRGVAVFGPGAAAARIETSKVFAKELMRRAGVPTARWVSGGRESRADLFDFVLELDGHCVVKADGLALGKGVAVCDDRDDATAALAACLNERRFGDAGDVVVVEERLEGEELSVFAVTDGEHVQLLAPARDYKRALDGDRGPNTGGMGAYAPARDDLALLDSAVETVIRPTLAALAEAGTPFVGCLYAGLMLTARGPRVLEFNARFGDPEAQVILPIAGAGVLDTLNAAARGELVDAPAAPSAEAAVVVVACADGYPAPPRVGDVVHGLDEAGEHALVFQAGTARRQTGELVTAGGRVLGVVGRGADVAAARGQAYASIERVQFDGMRIRTDIAVSTSGVTP
jgi:phosphoribosylamine--glycine ligase